MFVSKKIILIKSKKLKLKAELNNTETAEVIYKSLPIESTVNTWGEEIYFEIPVKMKLENPVTSVKIGDIGYWPPENCFCIFFGKTPITKDENEIKPASAVSLIGKVLDDPKELKILKDGDKIRIEKL